MANINVFSSDTGYIIVLYSHWLWMRIYTAWISHNLELMCLELDWEKGITYIYSLYTGLATHNII